MQYRCNIFPHAERFSSGGAGKASDFPPAIEAGADAVLAASIFHYGKVTIGEVKDAIKAAGYTVR